MSIGNPLYNDREAIKTILEDVLPSKVRNRDIEGYASLFTEDAIWVPPNTVQREGRVRIAEGLEKVLADQNIDPTFTAEHIGVAERLGYVFGSVAKNILERRGLRTTLPQAVS
jgi:ketosteroid isomerase-like protein